MGLTCIGHLAYASPGGALLLYVIVAKALHVEELSQLMRMVGGRFGRGPQGSPAR